MPIDDITDDIALLAVVAVGSDLDKSSWRELRIPAVRWGQIRGGSCVDRCASGPSSNGAGDGRSLRGMDSDRHGARLAFAPAASGLAHCSRTRNRDI